MKNYVVRAIIEIKPELDDPEGDVILKNLILKKNSTVSQVRTSKILTFIIYETNKQTAKSVVTKLCDELRLYNKLVSTMSVDVIN